MPRVVSALRTESWLIVSTSYFHGGQPEQRFPLHTAMCLPSPRNRVLPGGLRGCLALRMLWTVLLSMDTILSCRALGERPH